MPQVALTGQDTVQINGRIITALADGTPFDIQFPNDFGMVKVGKNGNSIYAKNSMGIVADVTMRLILGSSDDQYMTGLLAEWDRDESNFTLMTAMFVKRVGNGAGSVQSKIYQCSGGFFKRQVPAKTVADSDTDQSVAIYQMQFVCHPSSIQG